jgi:hypothetical protein
MASLLFAASFLTYSKIKDKRAAKKEAKRKGYETRYNELEREHSQPQEKHVQMQQTGSSQGTDRNVSATRQPQDVFEDAPAERRSSESDRASTHSRDDPSAWVDGVLKEREMREGSRQMSSTGQ